MRLMIISDIHGIKTNLGIIKHRYTELNCQKLIVLGDLYAGPDCEDRDVDFVRSFLESFKDNMICVLGNCDIFVNPELEPFPIEGTLAKLQTVYSNIYFTHGHIYSPKNWNNHNSILISGHTHVPSIFETSTNVFINPGSVSLPRNGSKAAYLFCNDNEFTIYDMQNNIIKHLEYTPKSTYIS